MWMSDNTMVNGKRALIQSAAIALLLTAAMTAQAVDPPVVTDEAKAAAQQVISNIATPTPEMQERINNLMKTMQSEEWQQRQKGMQAEAMRTVGIEPPKPETDQVSMNPDDTERLYVFVSSSMPVETLRNYAASLEKIQGGVMVLRGFVNGSRRAGPTAKFVASFMHRDPLCTDPTCEVRAVGVEIDPVVYHRYGITRVPAVVYEEHAHTNGYCGEGLTRAAQPKATEVVYGDASLRYAVETLYRKTHAPGLQRMEHELGG